MDRTRESCEPDNGRVINNGMNDLDLAVWGELIKYEGTNELT